MLHYKKRTTGKKDDDWEDDDTTPLPGTSGLIKKGPAVYFANDTLKTFADYDKLVDIDANGYQYRDEYLSRGYENSILYTKWVQSVYFASKNSFIDVKD